MKRILRRLREWRPLNSVLTAGIRSLARFRGKPIEMAVKHVPRVGPVSARLPNGATMRLESHGDDWVSNQVFWRGWDGYEPEASRLYYEHATSAAVTLDVGAHVGFYTVLAALANPAGRVYAFEPMPTALSRLRRHVEINALPNVEIVEAAVDERSATATFYHPGNELPCSASLVEEFMEWHRERAAVTVRTVALDEIVARARITRVDLVKLDIETAEPRALAGMHETLARDRPTIFCEVLPHPGVAERIEELIAPLGYRYFHLQPTGPRERDRIEADPRFLNYLLRP